jgi:hypothetical protein
VIDKKNMNEIIDTLLDVVSVPEPTVPNMGLDLDGTITESPAYFRTLNTVWKTTGAKVFVISYRSDYEKAKKDVESLIGEVDEIILVDSFDAKAAVIKERNIGIYYDDQPEMIHNIPDSVQVFLVRNGGNFDYDDRLWTMSDRTAKLV